jgi:citrate synthase
MTRTTTGPDIERRATARTGDGRWRSALTLVAPNAVNIRGYAVDEMMGRLSFADAVYLLLMGELPSASIGRMLNAILVATLDHGVTPPSTLAARHVATSGAPLKDCVAAGILAFGPHHGGDIESCMRYLDRGLTLVRGGQPMAQAAERLVDECLQIGQTPPGFGHRVHTRDPRATRLFQLAMELELEG